MVLLAADMEGLMIMNWICSPCGRAEKALYGVGNTERQVGEPGEEQAHHAYDAGEATGRRRGLSAQGPAQVSLQTSGWPTALIKKHSCLKIKLCFFPNIYAQNFLTSHKIRCIYS